MENFNKILKNVVIFLAIFLTINYVLQSCQNKEVELITDGNVTVTTSKTEYSRSQLVTVKVKNNSTETITIKNECPSEPLSVFRSENNEWVQQNVSPELNCENAKDLEIETGKELSLNYNDWNYALFSEMGRFKIELQAELDGEEKIISSNEFLIVKEGIIKQLWQAVFFKPIYNGLIFLTVILPKHDLGFAIILLTLLIRTILLIPNQKAMLSQKKLQDIQPRLDKVKEKYKGDQQKISMETMAIWKEAKVNPLGSCLPLLMQFPFLLALFYVIKGGLNPDNSHYLYTTFNNFQLNDINVMFLGILDLTKANVYVLPLIIGGLQFVQIKLTTANKAKHKKNDDKKEKSIMNDMASASNMMLYMMPVMIAVFTASLPAGIGLYWGISTSYGIGQQLFVNKKKTEKEPTVRVIENN
jgi:YidC/Oxa1 family membrane protein insertase